MARSALSILLILIATATFAVARATIRELPVTALAPGPAIHFEEEKSVFSLGCASSAWEARGCLVDIAKSLVSFKTKVSEGCCDAAIDIADKCFNVFGSDSGLISVPSLAKVGCSTLKAPPS